MLSESKSQEPSLSLKKFKVPIIIWGCSMVGKSSFIRKLVKNEFFPNYTETLGLDYAQINVHLSEVELLVQLWDTCGQERFNSISKAQIKKCFGLLLMYDLSSRDSFEKIDDWIKEIDDRSLSIVLIGNKSDRVDRVISRQEGEAKAKSLKALFFETSNKEGDNIIESVGSLLQIILDKYLHEYTSVKKDLQEWVAKGLENIEEILPNNDRDSQYRSLTRNTILSLHSNSSKKQKKKTCCGGGEEDEKKKKEKSKDNK